MRTKHESHYLHRLGYRLRFLRKMLGLSQTRFANALGVHRNTIGRYERGTHKVPDQVLKRIETIYAPDFMRIRAKKKIARDKTVRRGRMAHQWEKQQSKRNSPAQAKQDRERYYAELRGARAVFNRWCPPTFVAASIYFSAWFSVQNGFPALPPPSVFQNLCAILAAFMIVFLSLPVLGQTIAFVRRQRQYYPQILTLPETRPPNAWIWRLSNRHTFSQTV